MSLLPLNPYPPLNQGNFEHRDDVSWNQGSLIKLVTLDALQCTENDVSLA